MVDNLIYKYLYKCLLSLKVCPDPRLDKYTSQPKYSCKKKKKIHYYLLVCMKVNPTFTICCIYSCNSNTCIFFSKIFTRLEYIPPFLFLNKRDSKFTTLQLINFRARLVPIIGIKVSKQFFFLIYKTQI